VTDEGALRCWRSAEGSGPLVVLVHGTMDRSASFGRVVRYLGGFEVVRYDRRGYARSVHLGPPTGVAQQVADLIEVIGDRPALVAGHSYGGTIALAAAQTHPRFVLGVVAYEAPMPWSDWWPRSSAGGRAVADAADPEDAAERFMRRMLGDRRWDRLPAATRAARRAEGPTLVAEMAQLRPPNPPAFEPTLVAVPVVAARGTDGAEHHHRAAEELARRAPGAELVVLDGVGHGAHLTHPGRFAGLVEMLARRVADRGPQAEAPTRP
jgi:pimeloyl-ACP methyl ester carboxylesterase